METIKLMREEVKKYIDTADEKVVKMMHAILEADADEDWWHSMPENVKADVGAALEESKKGQLTTHEEIKKRYQKDYA